MSVFNPIAFLIYRNNSSWEETSHNETKLLFCITNIVNEILLCYKIYDGFLL